MNRPEQAGSTPELVIDGGVATIRLRRPAQANRIESGDLVVLMDHFRTLREGRAQIRSLVFTASGKHFSAGFDLGSIASTLKVGESNAFADMVNTLEALPQTTVCALNGGVFGGSTDLALACDFRLGVPETRMFMPAARFGLHYYESGLRRYLTRLGLNGAKRLFLLADETDSQTLLDIGYLTAIVPAEHLQNESMKIARRAAVLAPLACAGMKAALNEMAAGIYDSAVGLMRENACTTSSDLQEGLSASREKRVANFSGR